MRRTIQPPDLKRPESRNRSSTDKNRPDLAAASGTSAGMPRFLRPAQVASASEHEAHARAQPGAGTIEEALEEQQAQRATDERGEVAAEKQVASVPDVSGAGIETQTSAYGVTLNGRTDADFSSSLRTRNVRTSAATGCEGCADSDCVHVTGTLVSTFRVRTTVTLPSVSDFPDLTACQRQRVQDAITNVLAPHEQQHVDAFRTYNGTVTTPFDFTLCRADFEARVQELHDSIESGRRGSAQAASDALDPFNFEVDLDCED